MLSRIMAGLALIGVATSWHLASADPCGMVPPVQIIERDAIKRVGLQKTFVSYHKGVETMVLRPGFSGKVDEFGMLIPFPSVPALRKVDDNIFAHIAAAVDPPEVHAYVIRNRYRNLKKASSRAMPGAVAETAAKDDDLSFNEVRVVKREAVGMYDVAVLEAGSSNALSVWMDDNGFRYPTGMDKTVQDYVDIRWVFVAIKTKVGQKDGVNPRPGMRKVNSKLPAGANFNGHVQAMGFRFKSDRLVVPMRLSAFNPGELRNVVYILTDGPRRIQDIPKRYVKRQISGKELFNNVTKPLPLRVVNGKYSELQAWQKQNLKTQRDPTRHNGKAKELFAADLLAVQSGRLANPVEEKEKDLLAIGERLGLRGHQLDQLHDQVLDKERKKAEKRALRRLQRMTLTVVDGDFERDLLARQNLTFARYRMPKHRNNKLKYDSVRFGPGQKMGGNLYRSASMDSIDTLEKVAQADDILSLPDAPAAPAVSSSWSRWTSVGLGAGVFLVLFSLIRRRRSRPLNSSWLVLVLGVSFGAAVVSSSARLAHGVPATNLQQLIADLGDGDRAEAAVRQLKSFGTWAIDPLADEVADSQDMVKVGWAIVAIGEIGGDKATKVLTEIHQDGSKSMLVRTWAAAARIDMARTTEEVLALMPLSASFPSLQRPLTKRVLATVGQAKGPAAAEAMLSISARMPQLQAQLAQSILDLGAPALVATMAGSKDQNARRMAASYLASLGNQKPEAVANAVIEAYRFSPKAKDVPWAGGALFVPGIRWQQKTARALADQLLRWHLWADLNKKPQLQQQIHNNLRSVSLARVAGYGSPGWNNSATSQWLTVWGRVVGKKAMRSLLAQQNAVKQYQGVLNQLR